MTGEQEADMFKTIGVIETKLDEYRGATKKALDLITGNGRPEDGILYVMTDLRHQMLSIMETHKACPLLTGTLQRDVIMPIQRDIEKLEQVNELTGAVAAATKQAKKDTLDIKGLKTFWGKATPLLTHWVTWTLITLGAGAWTGWVNRYPIVKMLYGFIKGIWTNYTNGGVQ